MRLLQRAVIVSKYILRDDNRTHGSGNAGLTNFFRTFGGPLTFVVILTDVLKAVVAVWVGVLTVQYWGGGTIWAQEEIAFEIVKYGPASSACWATCFPACLGPGRQRHPLRRNRCLPAGLAAGSAGLGRLFAADSSDPLCLAGLHLCRRVVPVGTWLFVSHDRMIMLLSLIITALILWKHRANFMRLIHGKESKLTFHKKKEGV